MEQRADTKSDERETSNKFSLCLDDLWHTASHVFLDHCYSYDLVIQDLDNGEPSLLLAKKVGKSRHGSGLLSTGTGAQRATVLVSICFGDSKFPDSCEQLSTLEPGWEDTE